jgi:hypothetical protein
MKGWEGGENSITRSCHNLYSSPSTFRINLSKRLRWEGHVVRMGEKKNA